MKYYVVDAFTDTFFKGNQAGVCVLEKLLDEKTMQNIAFENNLSETAFLIKNSDYYDLRWFTPEYYEIDLCGHATLASAYILFSFFEKDICEIKFNTQSGLLTVKQLNDKLTMNFPSRKPVKTEIPSGLSMALGTEILETHVSRDLVVVLKDEETVANLTPDFELIKKFNDYFGIIVTAKGISCDFVSRYFAPNSGIIEDPVTGSSHSTLIPFWSERLNKAEMLAKQLSKRGGILFCKDLNERVEISGTAVLYMTGEILI